MKRRNWLAQARRSPPASAWRHWRWQQPSFATSQVGRLFIVAEALVSLPA